MFRLLRVIIRPSSEVIQNYLNIVYNKITFRTIRAVYRMHVAEQAARYETITYTDFITNILGSLEYTAEVQTSLYNYFNHGITHLLVCLSVNL